MNKYGMIDSVNEIDEGGATSLAPKPAPANESKTDSVSLPDLAKGIKPQTATSLAPNGGGAEIPQDNAPKAPNTPSPNLTPAMEKLKKAMLSGAKDAIRQASTTGEVSPSPIPMWGSPEQYAMPINKKSGGAAMPKMQEELQPKPPPQVVTSAKGVKGWNQGNVFVELPQDIDANDSEAVAKRMELDEQVISWMAEDEED